MMGYPLVFGRQFAPISVQMGKICIIVLNAENSDILELIRSRGPEYLFFHHVPELQAAEKTSHVITLVVVMLPADLIHLQLQTLIVDDKAGDQLQ